MATYQIRAYPRNAEDKTKPQWTSYRVYKWRWFPLVWEWISPPGMFDQQQAEDWLNKLLVPQPEFKILKTVET